MCCMNKALTNSRGMTLIGVKFGTSTSMNFGSLSRRKGTILIISRKSSRVTSFRSAGRLMMLTNSTSLKIPIRP